MPTVTQHIRKSLLKDVPERVPQLEELRRAQRSEEFERLRLNRTVMGAFRYGQLQKGSGVGRDSMGSIITRAKKYAKDKNPEHLVDIANLAMVEFVSSKLDVQSIDDGEHTEHKL